MLSNFHKTTSEHWRRTPGIQKGSPISMRGSRTKCKRQIRDKRLRDGAHPGEGVVKEKFPHNRKPSHMPVCGEFWNLRGQPNWKGEKKKKPTEYMPNGNYMRRWRSGTDASATSEWGLCREAQAPSLVLRVRTGPECPEDNMRSSYEIAIQTMGWPERQKNKKTPFLQKALTLHGWPPGVLTQHRTARIPEENTKSRIPKESKPAAIQGPPSPDAEREACNSQSQKARGCFNLGPRVHIFHQTVSRVPVANHIFLGSWMADICQKCHSLISSQGRHRANLDSALAAQPGNRAARTREVSKMHGPPETVSSPSTGHPNKTHSPSGSVPLWSPQEPKQLRHGMCTKCRAHSGQRPCRASWSLSSVDTGRTRCLGLWQTQCGPSMRALPAHASSICCSIPPSHNAFVQMSLNRWPPSPPCVRAEIRHWRDLRTEGAKINK